MLLFEVAACHWYVMLVFWFTAAVFGKEAWTGICLMNTEQQCPSFPVQFEACEESSNQ